MVNFTGIDIGGANIKLATINGQSKQIPFPIWKDENQLGRILRELAISLSPNTLLGVTMTAELADCFASKKDGVAFIVHSIVDSFPEHQPLFYCTNGTMCQSTEAIDQWRMVAASNWHALAWLAFSESEKQSGFVFDLGSTTCDIIPVLNGEPAIGEQNDLARLTAGQLVYAGVGRTPVCSLIPEFQLDCGRATVAREFFATLADVFLWLGHTRPDPDWFDTADGRPATKLHAGQRLARLVCADFNELGSHNVDAIADQTKTALLDHLSNGLSKVVSSNPAIPLVFKTFGKGAWLINEVLGQALDASQLARAEVISFSDDEITNQTAPALAVARKREQVHAQSVIPHG